MSAVYNRFHYPLSSPYSPVHNPGFVVTTEEKNFFEQSISQLSQHYTAAMRVASHLYTAVAALPIHPDRCAKCQWDYFIRHGHLFI